MLSGWDGCIVKSDWYELQRHGIDDKCHKIDQEIQMVFIKRKGVCSNIHDIFEVTVQLLMSITLHIHVQNNLVWYFRI